jgi:uncharacterized protein YdeI (YjbR/CyaY-like superfamily)
MPKSDQRIDAYIKKSGAFAQPILMHLRKLIHKACPEVEETLKWGMPHFQNEGAIICSMAAFKAHCAFGFWKAAIMRDPEKILHIADKHSMGHLDKIMTLKDLPKDTVLISYIRQAAQMNKEKIKLPQREKALRPKKSTIPSIFAEALLKNKKAKQHFDAFSDSKKYEYIEWITQAKTDITRKARIETSIEWLREGKSRNWKYIKKK